MNQLLVWPGAHSSAIQTETFFQAAFENSVRNSAEIFHPRKSRKAGWRKKEQSEVGRVPRRISLHVSSNVHVGSCFLIFSLVPPPRSPLIRLIPSPCRVSLILQGRCSRKFCWHSQTSFSAVYSRIPGPPFLLFPLLFAKSVITTGSRLKCCSSGHTWPRRVVRERVNPREYINFFFFFSRQVPRKTHLFAPPAPIIRRDEHENVCGRDCSPFARPHPLAHRFGRYSPSARVSLLARFEGTPFENPPLETLSLPGNFSAR